MKPEELVRGDTYFDRYCSGEPPIKMRYCGAHPTDAKLYIFQSMQLRQAGPMMLGPEYYALREDHIREHVHPLGFGPEVRGTETRHGARYFDTGKARDCIMVGRVPESDDCYVVLDKECRSPYIVHIDRLRHVVREP